MIVFGCPKFYPIRTVRWKKRFGQWFDKPIQLLYRHIYPFVLLFWRLSKFPSHGVQVAYWVNTKVLLVKTSYLEGYGFPGGDVRAGELPVRAAGRELMEETGIIAKISNMKLVSDRQYRHREIDFHDQIFEYRARLEPMVQIDNREIIEAGFFSCRDALKLPLSDTVRQYLNKAQSGFRP